MMNRQARRAVIAGLISAGVLAPGQAALFVPAAPAIIKPAGFWKPHENKLQLAMPLTMGMLVPSAEPPAYISDAAGAFTTTTTPTLSYTMAAGSNCLIVTVNFYDGSVVTTISGITYNGVALTPAIEANSYSGSSTDCYSSIWYLLNPYMGGAANIVATISSGDPSASWICGISTKGISSVFSTASDFNAAADTTGVGILTDGSGPSLIIGSTCINVNDATIVWTSTGPAMTEINQVANSISQSTAYGKQTTPGSTTVTCTHSSASRPASVFARFT